MSWMDFNDWVYDWTWLLSPVFAGIFFVILFTCC